MNKSKAIATVELLGTIKQRLFFTSALTAWGSTHGRTGLPWQVRDAYAVWVSEVMLQQTQVETVKAYYLKFMTKWPTVSDLGQASEDDVMAAWAGLGYYRRAKFLHQAARKVVHDYAGQMPLTVTQLCTLPGIGRSTAAAIASIAYKTPVAIMDGNVVRVLTRYFGYGENSQSTLAQKVLWYNAESLVDSELPDLYTQSIMDLGATVCTPKSPKCSECPMQMHCTALKQNTPTAYPVKVVSDKTRRVEYEKWRVVYDGTRVAMYKNVNAKGVWQSMFVFGMLSVSDRVAKPPFKQWSFKHVFSHYDLEANVSIYRVTPAKLDKLASTHGWSAIDLTDALSMALPKPVRDVVLAIQVV